MGRNWIKKNQHTLRPWTWTSDIVLRVVCGPIKTAIGNRDLVVVHRRVAVNPCGYGVALYRKVGERYFLVFMKKFGTRLSTIIVDSLTTCRRSPLFPHATKRNRRDGITTFIKENRV